MSLRTGTVVAALLALLAIPVPAVATEITTIWAAWYGATPDEPGQNDGIFLTDPYIDVAYAGEVDGSSIDTGVDIWQPDSSYVGGASLVSPHLGYGDILLDGSDGGTNTISFAIPVENPLVAIWSLGDATSAAVLTFSSTPTLEVGGPNAVYGGSALMVNGTTVTGLEGNGVLLFAGTFSTLSFTATPGSSFAFTVGLNGIPPAPCCPEPTTVALLGVGAFGLGYRRRRRR